MDNYIGIPKIPKSLTVSPKVDLPEISKKSIHDTNNFDSYEHSWQLIFHLLVEGGRNLPQLSKTVLIPLAIVTVVNIVLESLSTYFLPGFLRTLLLFLIFLTSSYNSIIPRTVYWVVIFTVGKTLFRRVRSEGFSKVMSDFRRLPIDFKEAKLSLGRFTNYFLLIGIGLGFVTANFLSRNNRIDKIAVCLVLAIAIINTLSKGKKGLLFTSIKLFYKDFTDFFKNTGAISENQIYVLISGYILGLISNTIFAFIKLDFGGYILGGILVAIGFILIFNNNKGVKENRV
ncbi:MAG: hypothetical protein SA378_05255 [Sedimentibacter sp.]|uniref:hypothetical protein n=1 Tax=Sedimentibacter sp. TaxID=1960295 RepID=UPI002981E428|nr:hypothetical protein [Sedimentibacter sp.]MDW5299529.1 hypothetical protein [Sedimentibacter sp.]